MDREKALEVLVTHAEMVNQDLEKLVRAVEVLNKRLTHLERVAVKVVEVKPD